jgi:hypothetical protein
LGLPLAVRWWCGLCLGWGIIFAVFIDSPLMRWVAKALFDGEIDPNPRPIKGRIVAYEKGIIRLKSDTSTLQWKTCLLTLIHFVWVATVNLFMVVMVFRPLAIWVAERI